MILELTELTGTKLPPTSSVWYVAEFTRRRPLSSTRVLPVPILRKLNAPISPRAALTPPEILSASLTKFCPFSGIRSNNSSPESMPNSARSSELYTETARASEIWPFFICVPVTAIFSILSSFCSSAS